MQLITTPFVWSKDIWMHEEIYMFKKNAYKTFLTENSSFFISSIICNELRFPLHPCYALSSFDTNRYFIFVRKLLVNHDRTCRRRENKVSNSYKSFVKNGKNGKCKM